MDRNRPWEIFQLYLDRYGPLPILTISFSIGWILAHLIKYIVLGVDHYKGINNMEISTQFMLLTLAWLGWVWGLAGRQKTIYHSGSYIAKKKDLTRYIMVFGGGFMFFLIIAPLSLIVASKTVESNWLKNLLFNGVFYISCIIVMVTISSEVIYNDPLNLWLKKIRVGSDQK